MKVLHVAAEVFPLVKTGGLADVMAALPVALADLGADVRLLLPGLPAVMDGVHGARTVIDIGACFGALRVRLLLARMPGSKLPVYVVDAPYLYRRGGSPYQDSQGQAWPDNLQRFALLGWVAAHLAGDDADPQWAPDIVHAHDWHAAMACAYMAERPVAHPAAHPAAHSVAHSAAHSPAHSAAHSPAHAARPAASVFTVHNLAFQGLFPVQDWPLLGAATRLLSPAGMEFHGQLSFIKAGLSFAHRVTTVSPNYAAEIATPEFGCGLDGVVRARGADVSGILNGIDGTLWNPATDGAIAAAYDAERLAGKTVCRRALQVELGLAVDEQALLLTVVSRLTAQKGLDLVLAALPELVARGVQFAVQGTGDPALEAAFRMAQTAHPGRVHTFVGYDEARAHRLIAGADVIAVPSRFEPCGLTQLYGLRYGTVPIVRRVGGLADTVVDVDSGTARHANGFVFDAATPAAFAHCVARAGAARAEQAAWQALMRTGMGQDLGWAGPARAYLDLYLNQ